MATDSEVNVVLRARDEMSQAFTGATSRVAGFVTLVGGIALSVHEAASEMIDYNSTLEQSALKFTALLGSTDKAKAKVAELTAFTETHPFSLDSVLGASARLEQFGGKVLDTTKNLERLGTLSVISGQSMDDMGRVVGRLYGALQTGQPIAYMVKSLQNMNAITPQVAAEMKKMQKEGESGNAIWKVYTDYVDKMGNVTSTFATTWEGSGVRIKNAIESMFGKGLKPLYDWILSKRNWLADWLRSPEVEVWTKRISTALITAMDLITKAVSPIAALFGALMTTIGTFVQAAVVGFTGFGYTASSTFNNVLGAVQKFAGWLASPSVQGVIRAFGQAVGDVFSAIWNVVSDIAGKVIGALRPIAEQVGQWAQSLAAVSPWLSDASVKGNQLVPVVWGLVGAYLAFKAAIVAQAVWDFASAMQGAASATEAMGVALDTVGGPWLIFARALTVVVGFMTYLYFSNKNFADLVQGVVKTALGVLKTAWDDLATAVQSVVNLGASVVHFLTSAAPAADAVRAALLGVAGAFVAVKLAAVGALVINSVVAAFKALIALQVVGWFAAFIGIIVEATPKVGLLTAAMTALDAAMDANIISLIVVGIAALIAILAYLYIRFEGVRQVLGAVWNAISTTAGIIASLLVANLRILWDMLGAVIDAFGRALGPIGAALAALGGLRIESGNLGAILGGVLKVGLLAILTAFITLAEVAHTLFLTLKAVEDGMIAMVDVARGDLAGALANVRQGFLDSVIAGQSLIALPGDVSRSVNKVSASMDAAFKKVSSGAKTSATDMSTAYASAAADSAQSVSSMASSISTTLGGITTQQQLNQQRSDIEATLEATFGVSSAVSTKLLGQMGETFGDIGKLGATDGEVLRAGFIDKINKLVGEATPKADALIKTYLTNFALLPENAGRSAAEMRARFLAQVTAMYPDNAKEVAHLVALYDSLHITLPPLMAAAGHAATEALLGAVTDSRTQARLDAGGVELGHGVLTGVQNALLEPKDRSVILQAVDSLVFSIRGKRNSALVAGFDIGHGTLTGVGAGLQEPTALGTIGDRVNSAVGLMRNYLSATYGVGSSAGSSMLQGLAAGLNDPRGRGAISGSIFSVFNDMKNQAAALLSNPHSPSPAYIPLGRSIPEGVAYGILQSSKLVTAAVAAMGLDPSAGLKGGLLTPAYAGAAGRSTARGGDTNIHVSVQSNADPYVIAGEVGWTVMKLRRKR